jgi:hypothetical protein
MKTEIHWPLKETITIKMMKLYKLGREWCFVEVSRKPKKYVGTNGLAGWWFWYTNIRGSL